MAFIDKFIPPKENQQGGWNMNYQQNQWSNSNQEKTEPKIFKTDWFKKEEPKTTANPTSHNTYTSKFHVNGEEIDQSKIDEILDKISESGYQSLTDREKTILFELSRKIK